MRYELLMSLWSPHLSTQIARTLLHSLWIGSALAVAVAALCFALRRRSAQARYFVAGMGLFALIASLPTTFVVIGRDQVHAALPKFEANLAAPNPRAGVSPLAASDLLTTTPVAAELVAPTMPTNGSAAVKAASSAIERWAPTIATVYAVGLTFMLGRLAVAFWGAQSLRRAAGRIHDGALFDLLARRAHKMGLKAAPLVGWVDRIAVPVVVGIVKPMILLPPALMTGLDPSQLEAVLAHELAHLRRFDLLLNALQRLAEAVLFYHPAAWYLSHRVRAEREIACDDLVLATGCSRVQYAGALLRLAEVCLWQRQPGATLLAISGESSSQFKRRVLRLLGQESPPPVLGRSTLLGLAILIAASFVGLLPFGVAGQSDEPKSNPPTEKPVITKQESKKADEPEKADRSEIARLADKVEKAIQAYSACELEAIYAENSETGSVRFLHHGDYWLVDNRTLVIDPKTGARKRGQAVAGFDGEKFFSATKDRLTLGEHELMETRWAPQNLFFRAGKSSRWLLTALRNANTRIDRRERVLQQACVVIVSDPVAVNGEGIRQPGHTPQPWRFEITLPVGAIGFPLKTVVTYNGATEVTETVESLAFTDTNLAYPSKIAIVEKGPPARSTSLRITNLKLRSNFTVREFQYADPLPVGYDIVDYRLGQVWHNDPWWAELGPWLREKYHWPRPYTSYLGSLKSFADPKIAGTPAPAIQAKQWFNGDPGPWRRAGRKLTALFFLGGDAIDPTPRWVAGLKSLQQRYQKDGFDVVCVAAANTTPATAKRTIASLAIPFPFAIDAESANRQSWGKTSETYAMKAYGGVLLIDAAGKVVFLDPNKDLDDGKVSALELRIRENLGLQPGQHRFADDSLQGSEDEHRYLYPMAEAIKAEWKRLRAAHKPNDHGQNRLWALLEFPGGKAPSDQKPAQWKITPELRLLVSNTPGGWLVLEESPLVNTTDEGIDWFGLPKGTYRCKITRDGFQPIEKTVVLPNADTGKPIKIEMTIAK